LRGGKGRERRGSRKEDGERRRSGVVRKSCGPFVDEKKFGVGWRAVNVRRRRAAEPASHY